VNRTALAITLIAVTAQVTRAEAPTYQPPTPKRAVPDYDGRGKPPARAADVALLPVRVLLSPLYVVSEMIRQTVGAVATAAERSELPRKAYDFFAFGPNHGIGVVPIGFVAFGLNPSVGAYAFWNDAFFVRGNNLHLRVEAWPDEWFGGLLSDRWRIDGDGNALQFRSTVVRRPDRPFYGLGPRSRQADESRYTEARFDTELSFEARTWRSSRVIVASGVRAMNVTAGHYQGDPSVDESASMGTFELPFGFGHSYAGPTGRLYATLDTRPADAPNGSGVHVEAQALAGSDLSRARASGWLRYGAVGSGVLDLDGHGRNVELSVAALFADPLSAEPIPFTELVTLGGPIWMTGYYPGRLVDRSAAVASLSYRWPIALYIDATLQGTVGNVFGAHLDGFDPGLLRLSGGIGLRTTTDPHVELFAGVGTDTFENGTKVQSVHLFFGVPQAF